MQRIAKSSKIQVMALNRRDFFRMGGLSLGVISPLGLCLPEVLANEAASGGGKQITLDIRVQMRSIIETSVFISL